MIKIFVFLISILSLFGCQVGRGGAISTPLAPAPTPHPTLTPIPTAKPTSVPVPTNTPTPKPSSTDGQFIPGTKFSGEVFSDTGQSLTGVTITARSLNPEVPYEKVEITDANGAYMFGNGPKDIDILLIASKDGYQTIEQTIVLKATPSGEPTINIFNFGSADPSMPSSAPGLKFES